MYGAIYGDIVGSIYEYNQLLEITSINPEKLICDNSFYSDDTILTIAILDAILNGQNYDKYIRKYIHEYRDYKPNFEPYFEHPFSPGIIRWSQINTFGTSKGNGALMRISPVPFMFDNEQDVLINTCLATQTTHKCKESINAATTLALLIYKLRTDYIKGEAFNEMNLNPQYEPFKRFNTTCNETLNNCLWAFHESNCFEDAMRKTLLMGGDTDTNCAIVGALAEAAYGIDDSIIDIVNSKIPDEFVKVLKKSNKYEGRI